MISKSHQTICNDQYNEESFAVAKSDICIIICRSEANIPNGILNLKQKKTDQKRIARLWESILTFSHVHRVAWVDTANLQLRRQFFKIQYTKLDYFSGAFYIHFCQAQFCLQLLDIDIYLFKYLLTLSGPGSENQSPYSNHN